MGVCKLKIHLLHVPVLWRVRVQQGGALPSEAGVFRVGCCQWMVGGAT